MDRLWITTHVAFLSSYWHTASEALKKVTEDPRAFAEFRRDASDERLLEMVLKGHLEHHNYSGVLLAYAVFDEFMTVLTRNLGRAAKAPIEPNELRDRGVRRYKKFVHKVCGVPTDQEGIDWDFLQDLAKVRDAIIHANGNKSHLRSRKELESVVARHEPLLSFKHEVKLVVSDDFVVKAIGTIQRTALAIHAVAAPDDSLVSEDGDSHGG